MHTCICMTLSLVALHNTHTQRRATPSFLLAAAHKLICKLLTAAVSHTRRTAHNIEQLRRSKRMQQRQEH